ncbi:sodium:proton antiporter [Marinimicrobium sp. ABcell2]|uniref:cation:proton antiporter n=1 Tax=Marinimicrobium sp. ABcell2 TaxID=3069751 RepID=UPI0027B438F9|nr:cation:proton antiporter [Marinimicrobium sp. ABcell2]MDQ2078427.1 cation:proton antiporter [Marinimicrobium sp. ABcell2]
MVDSFDIGHRVLESYDLLLIAVGLALLITAIGKPLLDRFNLNTTFIYLGVGLFGGPLVLDLAPKDPLAAAPVLERLTELGVIISLIVIGIRIGRPFRWSAWRSTVRLIMIVMPVTIALVALSGYWLLGLALGPAILLGAVLAPTDPILAGPLEEHALEDEAEHRFGLSSESGLNDGFAFPFIYLGLYFTFHQPQWQQWLGYWFLRDLVYAILIALPLGWVLGRLSGKLYLRLMLKSGRRWRHFTPLGLLLATYGLVEALGGYGFLAAFTAGIGFRQEMERDWNHLELFANFTESVDELLKVVILVALGALLRWDYFVAQGWVLVGFVLLLLLVIRPALTLVATAGGRFRIHDRLYWAWFGVRGIGSIYYLSYAINTGLDPELARTLFTVVAAVIVGSSLLHGFTLRPYLRRYGQY